MYASRHHPISQPPVQDGHLADAISLAESLPKETADYETPHFHSSSSQPPVQGGHLAKTISLAESLPELSRVMSKQANRAKLAPVHIALAAKKLQSLVAM